MIELNYTTKYADRVDFSDKLRSLTLMHPRVRFHVGRAPGILISQMVNFCYQAHTPSYIRFGLVEQEVIEEFDLKNTIIAKFNNPKCEWEEFAKITCTFDRW